MPPELINNITTYLGIIVAILGAFLFAFWVAMGIWAFNDIRARTRDWLAIGLACLLVLIIPIVGLLLYTMVRPKETLAEVYDRALEEEALLRELEESIACYACGVPVKDIWAYCPSCHNQLQHGCQNCSNLVRNEWEICVYCGAPQRAPNANSAPQRAPNANSVPQRAPNANSAPQRAPNDQRVSQNQNRRNQNFVPSGDFSAEEARYRPAGMSESRA